MASIGEEQSFHFFEFVELLVAQAWWAESVVAVNTEVAVLVSSDDSFASGTLAGCGGGVVQQAFGLLQSEWSFQTPVCLRRCSFAIQASFFCTLLSYVLRDPFGELQALGMGNPQVPSEVMYIAVCVMCSAATVRDTLTRALAP